MDPLNTYGDSCVSTTGTHGIDVASQRMDALDRECLRYVLNFQTDGPIAVDLGAGLGAQSLRMAMLGATVWMFDLLPIPERVAAYHRFAGSQTLRYFQKDINSLASQDLPDHVDVFYSQRLIHYLRFPVAKAVISLIARKMASGRRAFLSASGLHSELGQGYSEGNVATEKRFGKLQSDIACKHQILEPVCLYEKDDLLRLGQEAGLKPLSVDTSVFGNIKGIFEK